MMSEVDSEKSSHAYRTRQSLLWYTSIPFLVHILRFVNSILLARLLLPSDFGVIGIIAVILYYCDSFSDFGFGKAIIQRRYVSKGHYVSYFSFNILVSLVFFLSAQIYSDELEIFFEIDGLGEATAIYAYLFLITACSAGPRIKLQRDLRYKVLAIVEGIKIFISMPTSLYLASNGHGFWSIIYATLLANGVTMLILVYHSKILPVFNLKLSFLRDLLHFGMWDFVGAQFKLIGDSADKLIIGKVLGASALGFYDKALGLARMPNDQISMRVAHISFSSFSRLQDDEEKLRRYFHKMLTINIVILLPIFAGLMWVSELFTLVLLGEKWAPLIPSLQIFALSFIFVCIASPMTAINLAKGRVKAQTIISIIKAILLVTGMAVLAPHGIEYAAYVILSTNIYLLVFSYILMSTCTGIGVRDVVSCILPAATMAGFMLFVLCMMDVYVHFEHDWLDLVMQIVVGGIAYALAFLILPFSKVDFLKDRVKSRVASLIE